MKNTKALLAKLQKTYRQLEIARKTQDQPTQRNLADQVIDGLRQNINSVDLANAFVNNNIQTKNEAVNDLKRQVTQLKGISKKNKKVVHDLKKVQSDLKRVNNFPNRWINFTGNGKDKQMNLKSLLNAVQELEEYL